jgi:glycosyltransferase involved in cell wall biosynthesis
MRVCLVLQYALAPDLSQRITAGEHPKTEIYELQLRFRPEELDDNSASRSSNILVRAGFAIWRPLGPVLLAWWLQRKIDAIYVGNERQGILLAILLKFSRRRPRLVIFNHNLSNPRKAFLFRYLGLQNVVDAIACLNQYQATFLEEALDISPRKVHRVLWGVDGEFFSPQASSGSHRYVLSVGSECRDYVTFLAALRGTDVRAKLLSSGYLPSTQYQDARSRAVQDNVEAFTNISYVEMRRLYNECSFVVVPLLGDFDHPAGVTVIVEAMAMGKPVIATYSRGIEEFIEDSVTGFWVSPGSPTQLREKIQLLWSNPRLAKEMGDRARESVKARVDMERFANELAGIITGEMCPRVDSG